MKNILLFLLAIVCYASVSAKSINLLDSAKHIVEESMVLNPSIKDIDTIYTGKLYRFKVGDQIIDHKIKQGEGANGIVLAYLRGNHEGSVAITDIKEIPKKLETAEEALRKKYPMPDGITGAVSNVNLHVDTEDEKQTRHLQAEQKRAEDRNALLVTGIFSLFGFTVAGIKLFQERKNKKKSLATEAEKKIERMKKLPINASGSRFKPQWTSTMSLRPMVARIASLAILMMFANDTFAAGAVFSSNDRKIILAAIVVFLIVALIMGAIIHSSVNSYRNEQAYQRWLSMEKARRTREENERKKKIEAEEENSEHRDPGMAHA